MNYHHIHGFWHALRVGLGVITIPLYATLDVSLSSKKCTVGYGEPIEYYVQVKNTGSESAPVDIEINWPVSHFSATITTRAVGLIDRMEDGMRWYGFTVQPGHTQILKVKSIAPYYEAYLQDHMIASAESMQVMKKKDVSIEFSFDENSETGVVKTGYTDPGSDYVALVQGTTITIQVLLNDHCTISPPPAVLQVTQNPTLGTATVVGTAIEYENTGGNPTLTVPVLDYFEYEVCCSNSPETCATESVYLAIYHPGSAQAKIMEMNQQA
jgi:hypothetical protein